MGSTAYPDNDKKEVIWRTMICEREIGTARRAPPEYYDDWKSYCEVTRMFYLPGSFKQRVKEISFDFHGDQKSRTQVKGPKYMEEATQGC